MSEISLSTQTQESVRPLAPWQDIAMMNGEDWRLQLRHRLNTFQGFSTIPNLTEDEIAVLSAPGAFWVNMTPYYVSLMDSVDPHCAIPYVESCDSSTCAACQVRQREDKQQGVASLLAGKNRTMQPRWWQQTHQRSPD